MIDSGSKLDDIFCAAIEIESADARGQFIDQRCGEDSDLRSRVRKLVNAHFKLEGPLDAPAPGLSKLARQLSADRAFDVDVGSTISGYKIIRQLGEGGIGTVYLAEQSKPVKREVALKVIKLGMDTKQVIARFEAERQALAMMDHPNIARVFDAGATIVGRPFFVMELVDGTPIDEYCEKTKLSIPQRLSLFVQVCQAVQHAHQKGLIHRDIKPSNILVRTVDESHVAKVIDFGIAKATGARLTETTLYTEARQLVGTPQYMSPEQAGGRDIDTRTDVYSLGVVLYQLLTGTTPFGESELSTRSYDEMQRIIREVDPIKPSTRITKLGTFEASAARRLTATLRGELDWIVMKCIEKDRSRRYDSASALAADVMRYLKNEPVAAAAPSRVYRARKFALRNKVVVIASGAVVLALMAGTITTTIGFIGQSHQRAEAERQTHKAQQSREVAQAVAEFQTNMLASADPGKLLGDKVSVLQAIEASTKELDAGKLVGQPLVEANIRQSIGTTLVGLGRYDLAEPSLRRAIEIRRATLNEDDPAIGNSLNDLALALENEGKLDEAESLSREALAMFRRIEPANSAVVAMALNQLAEILRLRSQYADSHAVVDEALRIQRNAFPDGSAATGNSLNVLGMVQRAQGNPVEAEQSLREAVAMFERFRPPGHPDIQRASGNLAVSLNSQGKYAEAEKQYRRLLQIQQATLPQDHPDIAKTLSNLAGTLTKQNRPGDAEPLCREAMSRFEHAFGPTHWLTANSKLGLGRALIALNRFAEAEPILLDAERVLKVAQGVPFGRYQGSVDALYSLYLAWDQAEPGKGYGAQAARWDELFQRVRTDRQSATQPATVPTTK